MADKLLELYDELARPEIEYLKNTVYQGVTVLDIFIKKKAGWLKSEDQLGRELPKLPTFTGYARKIFADEGYALTDNEAKEGIWVRVNDTVKTKQLETSGTTGIIIPAHINLAFTIDRTTLLLIEDLFKANNKEEVKNAVASSMAKPRADLRFGLSYAVYSGRGGSDPQFTLYTPDYPTKVFNQTWAEFGGTPTKRQIEGLYSFVLNSDSDIGTGYPYSSGLSTLYGIDLSEVTHYQAKVFDFFTPSVTAQKFGNAPWGYDAKALGNTTWKIPASNLLGSSLSMTSGVPVIIDIISQAINEMTVDGNKPQFAICRRNLYSLIVRALKSVQWTSGIAGQEKAKDLLEIGYDEQIVIDGVPIIPDDTKREVIKGSPIYACPPDAIMFFNLESLIFEAHKDYNFVEDNEWKEVPGVVGQFVKEINATVRFALPDRQKQGIIKFAEILYNA